MSESSIEGQSEQADRKPSGLVRTFDRSDWLALFAMLISMAALAVSAYEASILREQQELMQTQQKAAVWPYLISDYTYSVDINQGITTWTHTVTNKGVGPALVKDVRMLFAGEAIQSYNELNSFIKAKFPADALVALSLTNIEGDVLSSNQEIELFKVITDDVSSSATKIFTSIDAQVDICYCSIYEDCWLVNQEEVQITEACSK